MHLLRLNFIFLFRTYKNKAFMVDITCQVKHFNDIHNKVQEILECFTEFPIEVHTDFWFFCHSKTREYDLVYPAKNTAYEVEKSFLKNFDDVDDYALNFKHIDPEHILDRHIVARMNNQWNESGLSMGRIFAIKMFVTSFGVDYDT